ncbi:MAG: FecCD family ABC transporter permease [Brevinematia bacterium]|jgi:iron complex transport system permease protein
MSIVRIFVLYFLISLLLVFLFFLSLEVGTTNVSLFRYLLLPEFRDSVIANILNIRLTQSLSVLISGLALSLSGFILQRVLRNYLVDPGITGVLSGSALGITILNLLSLSLVNFSLLRYSFSFLFGIFVGSILIIVSLKSKDTLRVVIFGVILNSFLSGLIVLVQSISNPYDIHSTFLFLSGSVGYVNWDLLFFDIVLVVLVLLIVVLFSKKLDIISLGDLDAHVLGVSVKVWRSIFLVFAIILSSISVSLTGVIGFLGFIVPNIVNLVFYKFSFFDTKHGLILSSLLGGVFLIVCFVFTKVVVSPYELPLGVITGLIGAPAFALILIKVSK